MPHLYKDVGIVNAKMVEGTLKEPATVTISYDENFGIQALATTTPGKAPSPNQYPSYLRDYEYKRLGTASLLVGLGFRTGHVIETVSDTHHISGFVSWSTTTRPISQHRRKPICDCIPNPA